MLASYWLAAESLRYRRFRRCLHLEVEKWVIREFKLQFSVLVHYKLLVTRGK
jgi:hypothetical protein